MYRIERYTQYLRSLGMDYYSDATFDYVVVFGRYNFEADVQFLDQNLVSVDCTILQTDNEQVKDTLEKLRQAYPEVDIRMEEKDNRLLDTALFVVEYTLFAVVFFPYKSLKDLHGHVLEILEMAKNSYKLIYDALQGDV